MSGSSTDLSLEPRLEPDTWLTRQLGKPAYHLIGDIGRRCLSTSHLSEMLGASPVFVDAKVAVTDIPSVAAAQRMGFLLIDTSLHFTMSLADLPHSAKAMFATPDMADAVGEIAARSFVHDRFHRDPEIPDVIADELKRSWATNFFAAGRGDWMVVACDEGCPVGFLQLILRPDGTLVVDLIAVTADQRGRGLAQNMIAFAGKNCECTGRVVVATQAGNTPSVRLYEKMGFRLDAAQYVFHHHGVAC
jgi:GNAT superfamily N-acetyltransferase